MTEAKAKREGLRILLDQDAATAYEGMVVRLKKELAHINVRPSIFVGHVLKKYLTDYFEKDLVSLRAAFFDAEAFYESEIKKAKAEGASFEQAMREALSAIDRIRNPQQQSAKRLAKKRSNESVQQKKLEPELD